MNCRENRKHTVYNLNPLKFVEICFIVNGGHFVKCSNSASLLPSCGHFGNNTPGPGRNKSVGLSTNVEFSLLLLFSFLHLGISEGVYCL